MTRKLSRIISAGTAALSLSIAAAVYAHDAPTSVNESGPVSANHEIAPSSASPAVGRSNHTTQARELRGPQPFDAPGAGTFEVQTPSSVNESAPWLTGQRDRR